MNTSLGHSVNHEMAAVQTFYKSAIVDQVKAAYCHKYPEALDWSVFVEYKSHYYTALAIVYVSKTEWKVAKKGSAMSDRNTALVSLYHMTATCLAPK